MGYHDNLREAATKRELWYPLCEDDCAVASVTVCVGLEKRHLLGTDANQDVRLFLQIVSEEVGLTDPFPDVLPVTAIFRDQVARFFAEEAPRVLDLLHGADRVELHWK